MNSPATTMSDPFKILGTMAGYMKFVGFEYGQDKFIRDAAYGFLSQFQKGDKEPTKDFCNMMYYYPADAEKCYTVKNLK